MAATATSTKTLPRTGFGGGSGPRRPGGNGHSGNGHRSRDDFSPNRYRIGMWVAMASILMLFTALTSAYIVRAASGGDWHPLSMPRILLLSTALLVLSSGTIETARRRVKADSPGSNVTWLYLTLALGIAFLGSQLMAWRELSKQGVYLSSHPHSAFFYLLTATHGFHLLAGLLGLTYVTVRAGRAKDQLSMRKSQAATGALALYWHFMDVLWIYLFVLLFFWK